MNSNYVYELKSFFYILRFIKEERSFYFKSSTLNMACRSWAILNEIACCLSCFWQQLLRHLFRVVKVLPLRLGCTWKVFFSVRALERLSETALWELAYRSRFYDRFLKCHIRRQNKGQPSIDKFKARPSRSGSCQTTAFSFWRKLFLILKLREKCDFDRQTLNKQTSF